MFSCASVVGRVSFTKGQRVVLRRLATYGGVAALSLVAAAWVLKLRHADLHVPFTYRGDALFYEMEVKTVAESNSIFTLSRLGAPGVLNLHDFPPQFDSLHLLVLKVMSVFSRDWAFLVNLYFILGFPAVALSALAVLRHFGISAPTAATVSVLYAFLPSRLMKGQGHLFLDTFFQVPLALLVALWICGDGPPFIRRELKRWSWLELRSPRSAGALVICAVVATSGLYYAYFSSWLILVAGVFGSRHQRSPRNLVAALLVVGVIWSVVAMEATPTTIYRARHGENVEVAQRLPGEAEVFGMRIAQLLLPIEGHRLNVLRRLKDRYNETAPLHGESSLTSLGLVGAAGFLLLIGLQLVPRGLVSNQLPAALGTLNLSAVLLGTIGGFGSLFALLVSPVIRTYCRLNVFIAFISLFAFALAFDRFMRFLRFPGSRIRWTASLLVLAIGLYDEASIYAVPAYDEVKADYSSDARLIHQVEDLVPAEAMIFQLPFQSFPDAPSVQLVESYDLVRPYLHSRSLRWSFGSMRGREGEAWHRDVSALPTADMLHTIKSAGFAGVLIDRFGYSDQAAAIERDIGTALGALPLVSANQRLSFFKLAR